MEDWCMRAKPAPGSSASSIALGWCAGSRPPTGQSSWSDACMTERPSAGRRQSPWCDSSLSAQQSAWIGFRTHSSHLSSERYTVCMRLIDEIAGRDPALGDYRFARAEPALQLRPFVREYIGYVDHATVLV